MYSMQKFASFLSPLLGIGIFLVGSLAAQTIGSALTVSINVYPDSVLNDVSSHPVGINLDFLTDDDRYLNPKRKLVDALKAMGVKYLRYPGGNKSDFYFFSKPPYTKSEPTLARTGKGALGGREAMMKNNYTQFKFDVLDFDEFMSICKEIGAEPVIVVAGDEYNIDYPPGTTFSSRAQLIENASAWVKYANITKKYGVKYWLIGNETWNIYIKNGAAVYAEDVVAFSKAMKAVDPTISIVPNGNTDEWWQTLLPITRGYIDAVCVSNYPINTCDTVKSLLRPAEIAAQAIRKYGSTAEQSRLKVIVAEYGPFSWCKNGGDTFVNTTANNLVNLQIAFQQLEQPSIAFSCFWNTRWIDDGGGKFNGFDALDKNGYFNANGYGMMIVGKFLADNMIRTRSSGMLKSYASLSKDKRRLFLYVINPTLNPVRYTPVVGRYKLIGISQVYELAGTGPNYQKPTWQALKLASVTQAQMVRGSSVNVIEYRLR